MSAVTLPGWAYPTREAKLLHYFPAEGQPSLCRRYFAGMVSLMEPLSSQHDLTESRCCAACWRKAPDRTTCTCASAYGEFIGCQLHGIEADDTNRSEETR